MLTLIKYSTHECPACQRMAVFDAAVAQELGMDFIDVDMRDPASYRPYRSLLLSQHPLKRELALPAYLLIEDLNTSCVVRGELVGAMPRQSFQSELSMMAKTAQKVKPRLSRSG